MIDEKGISPSLNNIKAISEYPFPRNAKEVQSFLGLVSYFRKFIPNFSRKAIPLYDLLKKESRYEFETEQLDAFVKLKSKLVNQPILRLYDPHAETELH